MEIRGLGNKRRNLGNTLYLTDALLPELDQDEDQSVPLLPPQVSGPITLPTTDKSLRASLRRLYFPVASNPKKSGITVNSRRPYPKVKFLGRHPKPASQTASGAVPMPVPVPRPPPLPPHGQSPDSEGSPPDFIPSNPFSSDLPWLRIQTISSLSEVEDKPDLTRQAAAVLRSEFVKLGCEVSFNRIAEGVDEGFGWDFVVLCTPMGRTVKEEVVAVLERTYMRDYLWVHHLCVQRKYQASGLGTWLMERCKDMVRAKNKEGVLLFALREVVGWYGRQGFADFPTIPEREEWGGDKVMVWIKEKMQGDEAKVVDG